MDINEVTAAAASMWRAQRREIVASFGGTSMLPAIAPGEALRIVCGAEAAVDDVVLFFRSGRPIVHRVVAITSGGLWTRGDANVLPDGLVAFESVIGIASAISRGGEWNSIARDRSRPFADFVLIVSRAFGDAFVATLWRARSRAARITLRLVQRWRAGAPGA